MCGGGGRKARNARLYGCASVQFPREGKRKKEKEKREIEKADKRKEEKEGRKKDRCGIEQISLIDVLPKKNFKC